MSDLYTSSIRLHLLTKNQVWVTLNTTLSSSMGLTNMPVFSIRPPTPPHSALPLAYDTVCQQGCQGHRDEQYRSSNQISLGQPGAKPVTITYTSSQLCDKQALIKSLLSCYMAEKARLECFRESGPVYTGGILYLNVF